LIHLDTSFLIRALVSGSAEDRRLRDWINQNQGLGISAVAWAEFLCGPVVPPALELAAEVLDEPVPFLAEDAVAAARLFNLGARRRGSLADCMVAAVALRLGASLATANPDDFRKLGAAGPRLVSI
jgi:predicted nucleic acid-binding protein